MLKCKKLGNNNFLSSLDITTNEVFYILELAKKLKNKEINIELKNKVLGLIFNKSSTRTRVSFQVAMSRLGGTTIDLNPTTILFTSSIEFTNDTESSCKLQPIDKESSFA